MVETTDEMTTGAENSILEGKDSKKIRRMSVKKTPPFWFPALGFYVPSAAIALAVFFIAWWVFDDEEDLMGLVPASIIFGVILCCAVILREVIFRIRRNNLLFAQQRLDNNLKKVTRKQRGFYDENKLTLEKNSRLVSQIVEKSEAAKVLEKIPEAHWEVFELCDEYLHRIEKELEKIKVGSPRLAAITRSREKIGELHKFHLLAWTASESRTLIQAAEDSASMPVKIETASRALSIIDSAIEFYPEDQQLIESSNVVKEFITTANVSHLMEQAERAVFKGNRKQALSYYRDALFCLGRENVRSEERELIADKINLEIEKLKK